MIMENYEINILKRNGDWKKIKPNAQEKTDEQNDINFLSNPKSLKEINNNPDLLSNINEVKLKIDIDRGEVEKIITLSSFLAKASGARGTPSIFINNDFFGGYLAQEKIEDLLK